MTRWAINLPPSNLVLNKKFKRESGLSDSGLVRLRRVHNILSVIGHDIYQYNKLWGKGEFWFKNISRDTKKFFFNKKIHDSSKLTTVLAFRIKKNI